jgi:hypothetical protein
MTEQQIFAAMKEFSRIVGELFNEQDFGGGIFLYMTTPNMTCCYMHGNMPLESYEMLKQAAKVAAPIKWIVE